MQNQTPTANLQALVPKFAARGQWFCTYLLHQISTTINTSQSTFSILKYLICTSKSRPHKLKDTSQRNKKSVTPYERRKKRTTRPPSQLANLGCINFLYELYHLYMMKQHLIKKHKRKFFWALPHNAPAMKKKTYPSKEENLRTSPRIRRQMAIISHIFPHPNK